MIQLIFFDKNKDWLVPAVSVFFVIIFAGLFFLNFFIEELIEFVVGIFYFFQMIFEQIKPLLGGGF